MDEADLAAKELAIKTDIALKNLRAKQAEQQAKETADNCVECGELIPSARQIAVPGCQLCVDCAEAYELATRGTPRT